MKNKAKLTGEEKDLLESFESGEWQSVGRSKKDLKKYQSYATATLKKDKRVNIRISSKDLEGIRRRAVEEGIPYQTLLSSIIHKYLTGRLVEA